MKEHPDYKYRPRRKPKTMVQKKADTGVGSGKPVPYSVRDLLPQHEMSGVGGGPAAQSAVGSVALMSAVGEQQSASTMAAVANFPRAYFSPYQQHHYSPSFYLQKMANNNVLAAGNGNEETAAGQATHGLAMNSIYSRPFYQINPCRLPNMMAAVNVVSNVGRCHVNCAECHLQALRAFGEPLVQQQPPPPPPRPAHASSTSSSTPSPPVIHSASATATSAATDTATATTIKRPIALLVKPDIPAGQPGLQIQHVI